jgi:hypothetical protein
MPGAPHTCMTLVPDHEPISVLGGQEELETGQSLAELKYREDSEWFERPVEEVQAKSA